MSKLSVVISAYNEEKKISDCLESIKWADEIIVINNSSVDKTAEIAKKYNAKIYTRENNLMLNVNKNFGFTKTNNEWILSLDADERVSPQLQEEISEILKNDPEATNGFWIPRKNIIFNKWIKHSGWYPDHQLRLFRKGAGKFPEKNVHEMIDITVKTEKLNNNLIHYNYETMAQFLFKHLNIYAPNEAQDLINNGYVFNYLDAIRFPFKEFLSRFFAREGYKDGMHGLMLSLFMAFYHLIIFSYIWEIHEFREANDPDFFENVRKEFKKSIKDLSFWFKQESLKTIKNPLKKIHYKLFKR